MKRAKNKNAIMKKKRKRKKKYLIYKVACGQK